LEYAILFGYDEKRHVGMLHSAKFSALAPVDAGSLGSKG